jgi:hypothetical protein
LKRQLPNGILWRREKFCEGDLYSSAAKGGIENEQQNIWVCVGGGFGFGFGCLSGAFAGGSMSQGGFRSFDSQDLIGAIVKTTHDDFLGLVSQLWVDTGGHAFAILNHGPDEYYGDGGGFTPIPLEAFRITELMPGQLQVVLNSNEKALEAAPAFNPVESTDLQYEANIYRYYGIQPYWTTSEECLLPWRKGEIRSRGRSFRSPT